MDASKPAVARSGTGPRLRPLPEPIRPLSPHSTSRLARRADTGLAHHEALRVDRFVAVLAANQTPPEPVPVTRSVWDWAAANDRKKAAIADLASLAATLDDIEIRIDELVTRVEQLERKD
jgi:hypothetical protein